MKVKAIYRDPKANPFSLRPTRTVIHADVDDNTVWEDIVCMAKEVTPKGLEFVEVIKEQS